jgi:hypothetical protein
MIARQTGEYEKAKNYLDRARAINPYLTAAEINIARQTLQELQRPAVASLK